MRAVIEVFVALLAVWGLVCLGWLALGRILLPPDGSGEVTVLPARGDAETLEQSVRGLIWLRCAGFETGPILILDRGLTPEGEAVARVLCRMEPDVVLCPPEELGKYLEQM